MFDDVCEAWKNVNEKHDNYIASCDPADGEDTDGDVWIGEIEKRFHEARKLVHKTKHEEK